MSLTRKLINLLPVKAQSILTSNAFAQAAWVFMGIVCTQSVRLGSNLVLTRLLFPDAFGVVALANSVALGVTMLSDVGIRGAVIKNQDKDPTIFMRTVWTIQNIKGVILAAIILIITIPVSNFYDEPILRTVLPFWALYALILHCKSVAGLIYEKNINLKVQVMSDIGSQIAAAIIMVAWAMISPSVWVLVAGTIGSAVITLINSYVLFKGHYWRWLLDRSSLKEIFSFGKWVVISTALGYFVNQGDRLIFGAFLTMEELGVYSIASIFASIVTLMIGTVCNRLLQPFYRKHINTNTLSNVVQARTLINLAALAVGLFLATFGALLIDVLYDDRYTAAGWILQLLAIRGVGLCFNSSLTPFLLANGDSFSQLKYQIVNVVYLVTAMIIGGNFGFKWLLLAYASGPIVSLPYMLFLARRHGLYMMRKDALFLGLGFAGILVIWTLTGAPVLDKL
ncbi:MAG: O-antigen/teichoic acid export membrane protein [Flavobacteriales bacterium]|jgi:O-antigen/teichoic acid export membrane protein